MFTKGPKDLPNYQQILELLDYAPRTALLHLVPGYKGRPAKSIAEAARMLKTTRAKLLKTLKAGPNPTH